MEEELDINFFNESKEEKRKKYGFKYALEVGDTFYYLAKNAEEIQKRTVKECNEWRITDNYGSEFNRCAGYNCFETKEEAEEALKIFLINKKKIINVGGTNVKNNRI